MTTYSHTIILDDDEMIALQAALKMLINYWKKQKKC